MKNIFIAILSLAAFSSIAGAQSNTSVAEGTASSPSRAIRRALPQAHLDYSQPEGPDAANYQMNRQGWDVGVLFDIGTARHLVLETGLLYRELNGQSQDTFGTTNYTSRYISIPAAAKLYFQSQDETSFYLKAGAMASTLATRDVTYSPGYTGSSKDFNGRAWEMAGIAGAGMKFVITPQSDLFVEADYIRPTDSIFNNQTVYETAWNFGLGFGINL